MRGFARAVGLAAVIGVLAVGCDRDPGQPEAGDCYEEPPRDLEAVTPVACEEGHYELVAVAALDDEGTTAYPGVASLSSIAFDRCFEAAEEHTGGDLVGAGLDVWFHHPSEATWSAGDRRFVCAVTRLDGGPLGAPVGGGG
jgi:hypothetical protein